MGISPLSYPPVSITDNTSGENPDTLQCFYVVYVATGAEKRQQHKEAYEKVLKEKAKLTIRLVRFNYIGLPLCGKSSFRRRLTKEILNLKRESELGKRQQSSTGVAEAGGQIFITKQSSTNVGAIQSKNWSAVNTLHGEADMLGQLFVQTATKHSRICDFLFFICAFFAFLWTSFLSICRRLKSHSRVLDPVTESNLDIIIDEAVKAGDWDKIKVLLEDIILLISTDTGGQAAFLDLQASLVQGPSFNLLFSRLVDDLDSPFEVSYKSSKGNSTVSKSQKTVEEVLFQLLSSVACYSGVFSSDSQCGKPNQKSSKSKLMFVGTHLDMVTPEVVERKDKLLQEKIRCTPFFDKGIIQFAEEGRLILPTNNWSGSVEEITWIQSVLTNVIEKNFNEVTIPASWLVLSLQIRFKKLKVISLKDCETLARKFGIGPSELQHALWFLHHRVGVLLYYPELEPLKGTVICDHQVLFESTTNLITDTFTFERLSDQRVCEEFREKAQFSLKDVQDAMMVPKDGLIPLEKLVVLLEYLGILTAIPPTLSSGGNSATEPTYFMPCVLKSATASELNIYNHSQTDPAPLILRYDCGFVPIGIFPSLITNLVSQKLGLWKMIEKGLRKNRVQFLVGENCDTVTLISRPQYLEILVSQSEGFESPTDSLCSHVREVIQSTLDTITSHMNYHFSMGYKFGFFCECPSHPGREHICLLAHGKARRRMRCLHSKSSETSPLEKCHQVWFSCGHAGVCS